MFVGVESWGWVLELVLLEVLSEVEVVGVGWVFVGFGLVVGVGLVGSSFKSSLSSSLGSSLGFSSESMSISSLRSVRISSSIRGSISSS